MTETEKSYGDKFFKWGTNKIKKLILSTKNKLLIICIKKNNIFWAKRLIRLGADINCVDNLGRTLVHIAMSDMKIKKGKNIEQLKNEKIRLIKFLISMGFDTDKASHIKGIHGEEIEITALQYACQTQKVDFVKALIEMGANVNSKMTSSNGCTALMYACKQRFCEIIYILLNNFADPNIPDNEGNTPLHEACKKNDLKMVKLLIEKGADVNKKNNKGETSLHIACKNNFVLMSCLLVQLGADIESMTNDNSRPIHYACEGGSIDVVKFLLSKNVNVNVKTTENNTPLKISIIKNNDVLAEELLKANANINETYTNGWKAMHFAVENNSLSIVNLLHKFGADLNTKASNNVTPYKLACKNKNTEIKYFLKERMSIAENESSELIEYKEIAKNIVQIGSVGKRIYCEINR